MGLDDKGPGNQPRGGPIKVIPVYNFDTKQKVDVNPQRIAAILDNIGRGPDKIPKFDEVKRIFLMNSDTKAGSDSKAVPSSVKPDTLVLADPQEASLVWQEAQKKGPDSHYPPKVPREFANDFARLANADTEEAYWQVLNEINKGADWYRQIDDRHSVRYLENMIGVVQGAADLARTEKTLLDDQRKTLLPALQIDLERVDRMASDKISQVQDTANRRLETLNKRLDLSDFGTLLRYGLTSIAATGYTVYKTLTDWLASWPAGAKGGLVAGAAGALAGAAFAFRSYVHRLIKRTSEKETSDCKELRDNSDRRQKEILKRHGEHMTGMARDWNEAVRRHMLEVTIKCFDVAMDFFPEYVKEEMKKFGADWGEKDFTGQNREEARRIIASGLHKQMPARVVEEAVAKLQEKKE